MGMTCANCGPCGGCKCPHHKIIPLCITLVGVAFLLQAWGIVSASFTAWAWPLLLTIIGLMKLMGGTCKCCGPDTKK